MAYQCSVVALPAISKELNTSIAAIRDKEDRIVEIGNCSSLGTLTCHLTAGRPHEIRGRNIWNSGIAGEVMHTQSVPDHLKLILDRAIKHSDLSGYGYYSDTRVPVNILVELATQSRQKNIPIWIYYSEAAGGSIDCEYSWLLSAAEVRLFVWNEEHGNYYDFSRGSEEVSNVKAFSAGMNFMGVQNPKLLEKEFFAD